jgi:two-component system, chemotaxis family, protein-glutamate methylesterase/glutaminase
MIRIVLADDSQTFRQLAASILGEDPELEVVAEAINGREAIEVVERLRPDIVIMDIHMPLMDGLDATKEIMMRAPTPILIVSSAVDQRDVGLSLSATQAGALMAISKPRYLPGRGHEEFGQELRSMVRAMAQVKVVRRWAPRPAPATAPPPPPRRGASGRIRLVAIGASTGGPAALRRILMDLPRDFPAPIVVVQHIARGFAAGFAEWLAGSSPLRVKVAEAGEPLMHGVVYIAPDEQHLIVNSPLRVVLSADPPGAFRPSATVLFETAARAVNGDLAAVVLTGMGSDGVDGLEHVRRLGGVVLAQDEGSSVVYGMAQEANRRGLVDVTLAVEHIAAHLVAMACKEENAG